MHFRSTHDCEPVEWVNSEYGSEIREQYASGSGSYTILPDVTLLPRVMLGLGVSVVPDAERYPGGNGITSGSIWQRNTSGCL